MRLTLLRAKEALSSKSPADRLEFRLNRACERLLLHGKFAGSLQRLAVLAPYGQLTLPRYYRTVEGVKVNGLVYELANLFYEYLPGKSDTFGYSLNAVRDLGDGWAVMHTPTLLTAVPDPATPQQDFPDEGTISVDYTGSEILVVTLSGRDQSGAPVDLVFNGKETHANPFSRITRVHKEQGDVTVTVTFTDVDTTTTTLAIMDPLEEETYYRRYMIDTLKDQASVVVTALCKRRHIEFASDKDVLPFSNISALSLGMDALQYESEGDKTRADENWLSAVDILNQELKDTDGENSFPAVRFLYPAGTTPNLRSFY
jgi:hypothetical protein